MSVSAVLSAALQGLEVKFVQVEADLSNGLPMFHMVGYLASEVKEAGERVRTAIRNSGIVLPVKKTVINLSPGHVRKRGASFDLPIAAAILAALGLLEEERLARTLIIGELSLTGETRKVAGVLPITLAAQQYGCHTCIVPADNTGEGMLVKGIQVIGVGTLEEMYLYLSGQKSADPKEPSVRYSVMQPVEQHCMDFMDIKGQEAVKRAAEVAVAGGHNLLLIGPPGSGKSMLAKRIPTILPPLELEESMQITKIYSILGLLRQEQPLITRRPFREVHHSVTKSALIGGGTFPKPGEISLASGGVLFLDELAEYQKSVLEMLRQPLEERNVQIIRSQGTLVFPADFILVAAMNPCPCGHYPDYEKCTCTPGMLRQYLGKISQPFLDRIDICTESPRIRYEALQTERDAEDGWAEPSVQIRNRIIKARDIQRERYREDSFDVNARIEANAITKYCVLGRDEERLMKQAFETLCLTARTYHKILKVARTIADLAESEDIEAEHLREAIGYRTMDKKYWG